MFLWHVIRLCRRHKQQRKASRTLLPFLIHVKRFKVNLLPLFYSSTRDFCLPRLIGLIFLAGICFAKVQGLCYCIFRGAKFPRGKSGLANFCEAPLRWSATVKWLPLISAPVSLVILCEQKPENRIHVRITIDCNVHYKKGGKWRTVWLVQPRNIIPKHHTFMFKTPHVVHVLLRL